MSSRSSLDDKERIRQAIDIVDLVGSYTTLRRQGRGYVAHCPWHDDARPSLQVNPERQSFKCWVCNIGGDIFSFIMKMENVEFPEAVAMLADRAGIQLTPFRPGRSAVDSSGTSSAPAGSVTGSADDKRVLYQAAAWAEKAFHECLLRDPEAERARGYLRERGISDESIARFKLGYSPDRWDWLIKQAAKTNTFSPRVLERLGLLGRKQEGSGHYDRFKGRVLFSIRDVQGRPVAVGGRILPELAANNPAKYINSPESPLFSKSKMLFGLDCARDVLAKRRVALVMEGYTDCIIAQQFGFSNAVAVLGTALGREHVRASGPLRRFADTVVLVLDGDNAGQRRTNEILELFVAEQLDLRILTLPDGLDPCDFLLQRGSEAFKQLIDSTVDALEHAYRVATRGVDIDRDTHLANRALDTMMQTIAKAPQLRETTTSEHRIREWGMLNQLARWFRIDGKTLHNRLTELRSKQRPARTTTGDAMTTAEQSGAIAPLDQWDRELLELLLLEPESVAAAAEALRPEQLGSAAARRIFAVCVSLAAAGATPDFNRLLLEFDDPRVKNLLVELDEAGRTRGTNDAAGRLRELLESFRRREEERMARAQARTLDNRGLDAAAELEVLQKLIDQERSRQGISAPTEG